MFYFFLNFTQLYFVFALFFSFFKIIILFYLFIFYEEQAQSYRFTIETMIFIHFQFLRTNHRHPSHPTLKSLIQK